MSIDVRDYDSIRGALLSYGGIESAVTANGMAGPES